jgi:hypothetical protein
MKLVLRLCCCRRQQHIHAPQFQLLFHADQAAVAHQRSSDQILVAQHDAAPFPQEITTSTTNPYKICWNKKQQQQKPWLLVSIIIYSKKEKQKKKRKSPLIFSYTSLLRASSSSSSSSLIKFFHHFGLKSTGSREKSAYNFPGNSTISRDANFCFFPLKKHHEDCQAIHSGAAEKSPVYARLVLVLLRRTPSFFPCPTVPVFSSSPPTTPRVSVPHAY